MNLKASILFIIFGVSNFYAQDIIIQGKVMDSMTNTALPFAHIIFENFSLGTSSNEFGEFRFKIPDSLRNEKVIFSYVGFSVKSLTAQDILKTNTIFLTPKNEFLSEVSLTQILENNRFVYRPDRGSKTVGIGNMNAGLYPSTIARFYPKPDKFPEECFLESVQIYFYPVKEQEKLSPKFRLHIYNVQENGKPGDDILKDMVLQKSAGKSSMKISLLKYKIQIPKNGFYIGLEHLFIRENEYKEIKDYYINDSLVAKDFKYKRYAPVYKGVFAEPNEHLRVYFYQPEGWMNVSNWEISEENSEKNYITPIFKVKITD